MRGLWSWFRGRRPRFHVGDRVRVINGPFSDFEGTVKGVTRWRVDVAIDNMPAVAELAPDQLEQISAEG